MNKLIDRVPEPRTNVWKSTVTTVPYRLSHAFQSMMAKTGNEILLLLKTRSWKALAFQERSFYIILEISLRFLSVKSIQTIFL